VALINLKNLLKFIKIKFKNMENFEEKIYPESEEELEKAKKEAGVEKAPKTPEEVKLRFQRKIEEEMKKPNPDKELIEKYQQFVENPDLYFQDEMLIAMKERARQELLPPLIDEVMTKLMKLETHKEGKGFVKLFEGNEEDLRNLLQEGLEISFEAIWKDIVSDEKIPIPAKWEKLKTALYSEDARALIMEFLGGYMTCVGEPYFTRFTIESKFRSEKQRLLDFLSKARKEFLPKILPEDGIKEIDDYMHKVGFWWDTGKGKYIDTGQFYTRDRKWAKVPPDPYEILKIG
jgi:hypothetical protein